MEINGYSELPELMNNRDSHIPFHFYETVDLVNTTIRILTFLISSGH